MMERKPNKCVDILREGSCAHSVHSIIEVSKIAISKYRKYGSNTARRPSPFSFKLLYSVCVLEAV